MLKLNRFERKIKEEDLSEKSCNRIKSALNHFFKWCVEEELIRDTPLRLVKFKENCPQKNPHPVLTPEEVQEILKKAKDFEDGELYKFLVVLTYTAARKSEVLNIEWANIDFERNVIVLTKTKNKETREITMIPKLRSFIEALPRKGVYLFSNVRGERLSENTLRCYVARFKEVTRIKDNTWTMHSFRHAFAYAYKSAGMPIYHLQAILGHKTSKLTIDTYGRIGATDTKQFDPYQIKI